MSIEFLAEQITNISYSVEELTEKYKFWKFILIDILKMI